MVSHEPLAPLPVGAAAYDAAPVVLLDADFNTRWDAWVARGRVHELKVRRQLFVSAGVLAVGAAVAYALLRS